MIEQRTQQYSEEGERRGRWDLKLCASDCPRVSKGSRRQMGWRGRLSVQTSSALGGPGLYDTKHEKKKNRSLIPVTQGGPFLLGLPALLWPQTLLRNRGHPWIDQTNSEPLVPFSKNYQSWFKSHPFSPVNTINSNGLNKSRGKNILPGEMKVE